MPSPEATKILAENLKETLKSAQTYLLIGTGTALFLLILAIRGRLAPGAMEQDLTIPFVGLTAPTFTAALIAWFTYVLWGVMALVLVNHGRQIKEQLRLLDAPVDAVLTYPTILTIGKTTSMGAVLLPALLGLGALISAWGFSRGLAAALASSSPYLCLAYKLWKSPKVTAGPAAGPSAI